MIMELEITNNKDTGRFESSIEGQIAFVKYHLDDKQLVIISTQVPRELEGRGIAAALTKHVLEYAKQNNLKVHPLCSYTVTYIARHPEYKGLVESYK